MSHPFSIASPSDSGCSDEDSSERDTGLKSRYREKSKECESLKEQLGNAQRKERELSSRLREKQVILDYLEKKVFDQNCNSGFAQSTPMAPRPKMTFPGIMPITPPFARPPGQYLNATAESFNPQRGRTNPYQPVGILAGAPLSHGRHPHLTLSPTKYRVPNFDITGWTAAHPVGEQSAVAARTGQGSAVRKSADPCQPIDCRKRKCSSTAAVIEEVFPELSGMCKPYVRICITGGIKTFFCIHPSCSGKELNGNVWRKHYTSHFPDPDCGSPYHCPKCNMGFALYRPLSKHFPGCGADEFDQLT